MKKGVIIIAILALIIGFFVLRDSSPSVDERQRAQSSENSENSKDLLPSFSLQDFSGAMVSSNDFEGKALVLNSWATWCPFCKDELPDFITLQQEFEEEIAVIAIDRQESLKKAKAYTDGNGITDGLIYLLDPSDSFYRSIGGFSMPETIFVNSKGEIVIHKRGPMPLSEMREKVLSTLNS